MSKPKTASLRQNLEYADNKAVVSVLLETDYTKEIRISMQAGTIMKEHKTAYPLVLELIEGSVDFGVEDEVIPLSSGSLIALPATVPHSLKANEKSLLRLSLSKCSSSPE